MIKKISITFKKEYLNEQRSDLNKYVLFSNGKDIVDLQKQQHLEIKITLIYQH